MMMKCANLLRMRYEHVDDITLHTQIDTQVQRIRHMLLLHSGLAQARPEL